MGGDVAREAAERLATERCWTGNGRHADRGVGRMLRDDEYVSRSPSCVKTKGRGQTHLVSPSSSTSIAPGSTAASSPTCSSILSHFLVARLKAQSSLLTIPPPPPVPL